MAGVRAPRRLTPWIDNALLAREGLALVCPADNSGCIDPVACYVGTPLRGKPLKAAVCSKHIAGYSGRVLRFQLSEVALTVRYLGMAGATPRFMIMMVSRQEALAHDQ